MEGVGVLVVVVVVVVGWVVVVILFWKVGIWFVYLYLSLCGFWRV